MNLSAIPVVLFLLLPGFLTINIAILIGRFRRVSAFHGSAWSLLASFILVGCAYPAYVYLVDSPPGQDAWPGLSQVLVDPSLVPGFVWALIYVFALLTGTAAGFADRMGYVDRISLWLGIDLSKRGDVWSRQFRDADNVHVYMKDGTLLSGWPEYYSADMSHPGPELYLTNANIWSDEGYKWLEVKGVRGILVHGSEISRIEFLESPAEPDRETAQ